ncbi:sphingosine kinase 1 [Alligator sinensis]|uniref:sphingosine kinase n=1 Tax=Alligator sinensis TaxID=38654 RepID=A0A1U7RHY1_ALLSI|nr:sphingosine kinase 1 [Alligator sinensis]
MDGWQGPEDGSPQQGSAEVLLRGQFLLVPALRHSCALTLTRGGELHIQGVEAGLDSLSTVLKLADCICCCSFRGGETQEPAAYFSVFCYPFKKGWWDSSASRQRVVKTFQVSGSQDVEENLKLAETWAKKIRELSLPKIPKQEGVTYSLLPRPCRVLVLLNPQSGTGRALQLFHSHVQPMLTEANIAFTVFVTERPNHAHDFVQNGDLSSWNALVVMAGDGLMFEVVNGLMERQDWESALKKPLCILPGGSGNALAASINHYAGNEPAIREELLTNCTYILCKGLHTPMDLVSLRTASGKRLFSFLSFGWGFISDVDITSERYRKLGNARFTMGTVQCLAKLEVYKGRLSYLPVGETSASSSPYSEQSSSSGQSGHHTCYRNGHPSHILPQTVPGVSHVPEGTWPEDSLLVPFNQPVPKHWTVEPEEEFVSIFAIYQSHLGADYVMASKAKLHDGSMHLFYLKAGVSRTALLKLFLAIQKGTHMDLNCPQLRYIPVRAFRIEPFVAAGLMTVDGEMLPCEPVQGQVQNQLCRIIGGP